jgi:hypothetical protein
VHKKIVLFSIPRSGSTPIIDLIHASHKAVYPDAYCVHELVNNMFGFVRRGPQDLVSWLGTGNEPEDLKKIRSQPFAQGKELGNRIQ